MEQRAVAARGADTTGIAHVAVFAAVIAALSIVPAIPIGGLGVPITLQTLGIYLTAIVLGPTRGTMAVLLYLAVGTAGLPVFAGGKAGLGVWFGPTAGYLLAFPLIALAVGLAAQLLLRRGRSLWAWLALGAAMVATRLLIVYPLGTLGIARATGRGFGEVALADLAYWPGDLVKTVLAILVAIPVFKAFPALQRR